MKPSLPFKIILITDEKPFLVDRVKAALDGGIHAIQLRDTMRTSEALLPVAQELRALTQQYGAYLLINSSVELARMVNADGVHLPSYSAASVKDTRDSIGPHTWIGKSCHSFDELMLARQAGVDYAIVSPLYQTASKPGALPLAHALLRQWCTRCALPLFGLGGITHDTAQQVCALGFFGVAVKSSILDAPHITQAAQLLMARI